MLKINIGFNTQTIERIFPEIFENRDWVGYHGTSSAYSNLIESEGFRLKKPLPESDIAFVADLALKFPAAGADAHAVRGFLELGTVSFTSDPWVTLKFLLPSRLGGQGVGFVSDAACALLKYVNSKLSTAEKERLQRIVCRVSEIRSQPPVIYAVDLQQLSRINYDRTTAGIYAHQWVPSKLILAKALIGEHFDIGSKIADTTKVRALRVQAGSWLSTMHEARPSRRAWDVVSRVNNSEFTPWRLTAESADADRFESLTKEAFDPVQWVMLDEGEKTLAEKRFFRELTNAYIQVVQRSNVVDAEQLVGVCFRAFFGRDSKGAWLHTAPDDPELLAALQDLSKHEIASALEQHEIALLDQIVQKALPSSGMKFNKRM